MEMQNTRISITPLHVSYASRKPLQILIKIKRILISTNYELEKFQTKKQFPLKNNFVDLSAYAHMTTFNFKLSKQLEIANTKIDIIVFGFYNKDVNLLGIGTIDLGKYQHQDFKGDPLYKQFKLNLEKSQDPKSYITVAMLIQEMPKVITQPNIKQPKNQSEGFNSLKTQSYNKQSIIIGRRKKPDQPSAYQISRRNFKQVQIIRTVEERSQRSRSKSRNGSYKRRFQYQYSKQITSKQEEQRPAIPPTRHQQHKPQKNSPAPRMKTPQPITQFRYSTESQKQNSNRKLNNANKTTTNIHHNILYNSHRDGNRSFQQNPTNHNQVHLNNSEQLGRNRHKIIIDVQRKKINSKNVNQTERFKFQEEVYEEDISNNDNQNYIEKQNINKWQTYRPKVDPHRQNQGKIEQQNIRKNYNKNQTPQSFKKQKQNKLNNHNALNSFSYDSQNNVNELNRNDEENGQEQTDKFQNVGFQDEQKYQNNKFRENNLTPKQARKQNVIQNKQQKGWKRKQTFEDDQSPNQPKFTKVNSKETKNQRQKSVDNKYKSITQSLELAQKMINKKKAQSPINVSKQPERSNNSIKQNIIKHQSEDDDLEDLQPRKIHSPINDKKDQNQANTRLQEAQSSANTFKDQHYDSRMQNSPSHNKSDNQYVKSFSFEPQSNGKQKDKYNTSIKEATQSNQNFNKSNSNQDPQFSNITKISQKQDKKTSKNQEQEQPNKINISKNSEIKNKQSSKNEQNENNSDQSKNQSSVVNFSLTQTKKQESQRANQQGNTYKLSEEDFLKNDRNQQSMYQSDIINNNSGSGKPPNKVNSKNSNNQEKLPKNKLDQKQQEIQTSLKFIQKKQKKQNGLSNQISIKIQPTPQKQSIEKQATTKIQNKVQLNSQKQQPTKQIDPKILHKKCDQKINNLENLLDQQQENFRKISMEKQLQFKNQLKQQEKKIQDTYEKQIQKLKQQNSVLKQKQKQMREKQLRQPPKMVSKQSKQSASNAQQISRLKDQNNKLKNLVDKLNIQLEQSDEKNFEMLTSVQKKNLQFQRKMESINRKNNELTEQLKKKQEQLKQCIQKLNKASTSTPISVPTSSPILPLPSLQNSQNSQQQPALSQQQHNRNTSPSDPKIKQYEQQIKTQKRRNINLEAQIRKKQNQIRFLKIKNENLQQQKRDLQNQIDNIAANNKHELAKQGSIAKMNLQTASVTNSVKVQNKVLKQQINSLRKQVQQLNGLLEGIIVQGSINTERMSSNKQSAAKENQQNLIKKLHALEKKNQAYELEVKNKQMKIAEIINMIWSQGNPQLMDQINKLVGATK